jgi:hypothetical protein
MGKGKESNGQRDGLDAGQPMRRARRRHPSARRDGSLGREEEERGRERELAVTCGGVMR